MTFVLSARRPPEQFDDPLPEKVAQSAKPFAHPPSGGLPDRLNANYEHDGANETFFQGL